MQGKLKKHMNKEQVRNVFKCEECDETFESRGNCIDGYESGTGGTKQCNAFDEMFVVEKASVANYLIVHMEIGIARGFICEESDDIC